MTCQDLLKITGWLLLVAATLPTGWSKNASLSKEKWTKCEPKCHCIFADGRKQANCSGAGMNEVPTILSEEIQILLLNGNPIGRLEMVFCRYKTLCGVGQVYLQKIFMKNCAIEEVDQQAFADLELLSHIDLSDNRLRRLDPATFQQLANLRYLLMNNNFLQRLESNLFANLIHLQSVELNSNRLSDIHERAFLNLPKLKYLKFKDNKLVQLQPSTFASVRSLIGVSFDLRNNPWRCDCQLCQFFDFVKNNLSSSSPTMCGEPEYMRDRSWESLTKEQFTCQAPV